MMGAMTHSTKRRYEPDRRGRIIDTALSVIATHGVAGTTHRRVAEAADIPLGSMTYYFAGIDALVQEAFTQLSQDISGRYLARLEAAASVDEARDAVVDLICGDVWASDHNMTLQFELYAYMARNAELRQLTTDWMGRSRAALEKHFDAQTARALDAVIEGVTIHNFGGRNLIPEAEVRAMVEKLTR